MSVDMNVFRGFLQQVKMLPGMAQPTDCPDNARVEHAKAVFAKKIDNTVARHLEACVHCGICAQACHFYVQTQDPKFTPIRKLDPLKRYYRREKGPFSWLYRLTTRDITEADLEAWHPL